MKRKEIKRRHHHLLMALRQLIPTYEGELKRTAQQLLHTAWHNKFLLEQRRINTEEYYRMTFYLNRTIEMFWREEEKCLNGRRKKLDNRSHLTLVKR